MFVEVTDVRGVKHAVNTAQIASIEWGHVEGKLTGADVKLSNGHKLILDAANATTIEEAITTPPPAVQAKEAKPEASANGTQTK